MGTSLICDSVRFSGRSTARSCPEAPTILVLDPNWDSRQILGALLGAYGYRVLYAETVLEARQHALRRRVALIISESRDELGHGSLLAALREDLLLAEVPVVVHTSWVHPADRMAAAAYGALAFMSKPCDHRALLECVQSVADASRSDGSSTAEPVR